MRTRMGFVDVQDVETGEALRALIDLSTPYGKAFEHKGRTVRRAEGNTSRSVIDVPNLTVKDEAAYFKLHNLPLQKDVVGTDFTPAPDYDENGVGVIVGTRQREEFEAEFNDNPANGVQLVWDR